MGKEILVVSAPILHPQRDCGSAILLLSNQRLIKVFLYTNNYPYFLTKIA
jgi:hypothetical protein